MSEGSDAVRFAFSALLLIGPVGGELVTFFHPSLIGHNEFGVDQVESGVITGELVSGEVDELSVLDAPHTVDVSARDRAQCFE